MADRFGTILGDVDRDGLGWIALDDGTRVRFGNTSCEVLPVAGLRVRVPAVVAGWRGVLKATKVFPAEALPPGEREPTWDEVAARHATWSDVANVTLVPALTARPPIIPSMPAELAPWFAELEATLPTVVALGWPRPAATAFSPAVTDDFAHGSVAFLDEATWPACAVCARPFELCLQLSAAALAPWVPGRGGLVAMFCFHCGVAQPEAAAVAYVRFVRGDHAVRRPPVTETASSSPLRSTQPLTLAAPSRRAPSTMWYRYRSATVPDTGSAAVFGFAETLADEDDCVAAVEDWLDATARGGGDLVGGAPSWDQADATPSCAHGEMRQLCQYGGGQFLDGMLHVFVCTSGCPDVRHVAEF